MLRCPNCNSRKFHGNYKQKYCSNCGYTWKNSLYHKTIITKNFQIGHEKVSNTMKNHEKNDRDYSQVNLDYHDNVFKFKIKKDNPDIENFCSQKVNMSNWIKYYYKEGNWTFIKTPKNLIISIERRFLKDVYSTKEIKEGGKRILDLFIKQAILFSEKYNLLLDLSNPIPVMKEIKQDKLISPELFYGEKTKSVYPSKVIETFGRDAEISMANIFDNLAIETKADDLEVKMDGGFNTISFLLTQQNDLNAKILEILEHRSISSRIIKFIKECVRK